MRVGQHALGKQTAPHWKCCCASPQQTLGWCCSVEATMAGTWFCLRALRARWLHKAKLVPTAQGQQCAADNNWGKAGIAQTKGREPTTPGATCMAFPPTTNTGTAQSNCHRLRFPQADVDKTRLRSALHPIGGLHGGRQGQRVKQPLCWHILPASLPVLSIVCLPTFLLHSFFLSSPSPSLCLSLRYPPIPFSLLPAPSLTPS